MVEHEDHPRDYTRWFHSLIYTYLLQNGMEETAECFGKEGNVFDIIAPNLFGKAKEKVDKLWDIYIYDGQKELNELKAMSKQRTMNMLKEVHEKLEERKHRGPIVIPKDLQKCKIMETSSKRTLNTLNRLREVHKLLEEGKYRARGPIAILKDMQKCKIMETPCQNIRTIKKAKQEKSFTKSSNIMPELPNDLIVKILHEDPQIRFYNALYRYMIGNNMFESMRLLRKESGIPYITRQAFDVDKDDALKFWKFYTVNRAFVKVLFEPAESDRIVM